MSEQDNQEKEKIEQNNNNAELEEEDEEQEGHDMAVGPDEQENSQQENQSVKSKKSQQLENSAKKSENNQQQQQQSDRKSSVKSRNSKQSQHEQEQFQQEEIQVEEEKPKACPRCTKNIRSIDDQNNMTSILENQNDTLKQQVKDLQDMLNETLKKQKEKEEKNKIKKEIDPEEKKLKAKIDDITAKYMNYKEKIEKMQKQIDTDQNFERARQIQNEQKLIETEIEKLKAQNKQIDRDRKDNEYAIQLRNAEFVSAKKELEDELKKQRNILLQVRNNNRDFKTDMLVQQEYLVRLEQQHRDVCETYGASFSMVQSRIDNLTGLIQQNHMRKLAQYEKEEAAKEKFDITPENYRNQIRKIKELTEQKKKTIKENEKKLSEMQAKIQYAQREQDLKKQKLKEKEHEINIAILKINELKRHIKHNQLQPLNIEPQLRYERHVTTRSQQDLKINAKKFLQKNEPRTVIGGVLFNQDQIKYEDSEKLPQDKEYRLCEFTLYFIDDMILGMQSQYAVHNQENIVIEQFMPSNIGKESLQSRSIKLALTEYIKSVTGYYNKDHITYLEFVTSRSRKIQVGSDKNYRRQRKLELDIKDGEKPISFQIITDQAEKKAGGVGKLLEEKLLISIGLVCKKREIQPFQVANMFSRKTLSSVRSQENLQRGGKSSNKQQDSDLQSQENI